MKKLLLLAMMPVFAGHTPPADLNKILTGDFTQKASVRNSLKVVDWNIDRGEHLDEITAVLKRDQPDLCTLQEVDLGARRSGRKNVAEELAKRLEMAYAFAPSWQELSQGNKEEPSLQGQAILSRLPIKNVRVIHFKDQSTFWRPKPLVPNLPLFQRRIGGRIALVAELDDNGQTIVVYDPHLESRSGGHLQELQMDEILADAKRYPESTPIILAGDLNTKYDSKTMFEKLRDAGWQNAFGPHNPRTHTIVFSLDWIATRGPLKMDQAKVEKHSPGSDHMPISAIVSVK